jgi:hypothetical protein
MKPEDLLKCAANIFISPDDPSTAVIAPIIPSLSSSHTFPVRVFHPALPNNLSVLSSSSPR